MSLAGGALDDPAALAGYDQAGMFGHIAAMPAQILDGWQRTRSLTLPDSFRSLSSVALLGMGGSAIGGDLVRGIYSDRLTVPLAVIRDYELPAWVGPQTLVIASSYSGATEETVSSLSAALTRRCPVAVITTGGPIGEVGRKAGLPMLTFPGGGQPRAAVGYAVMLLAGLLERAGMLALDEAEVRGAHAAGQVTVTRCGPDIPTDENPAKQLAWALVDRLPVIEASGFLSVVARRWKTQLNENAKSTAVFEELPEATHNAVVGYPHPESIRDHLYVLFLASPLEHPRNRLRAALSAELLDTARISHQVVPVAGETRLAQAIAAIALGDLVSAYLAVLYGIDPTPVEAIGRIKARLSGAPHDAAGQDAP